MIHDNDGAVVVVVIIGALLLAALVYSATQDIRRERKERIVFCESLCQADKTACYKFFMGR